MRNASQGGQCSANCQLVFLPSFPPPPSLSFRAISDQADLPLRPVMDEDSVLEMLNSSLAFSLAESLCFSGPVSPAGCGNRSLKLPVRSARERGRTCVCQAPCGAVSSPGVNGGEGIGQRTGHPARQHIPSAASGSRSPVKMNTYCGSC